MSNAVRNISYISPYKSYEYSVIIPAAGLGTRMRFNKPKATLYINNKTIIERQISIINKVFCKKSIYVVGGYKKEELWKYLPSNIYKIENKNFDSTNIVKSIWEALKFIDNNLVIIIYGDLFFNKKILNLPFRNKSTVVLCDTMLEKEVGSNISNNKLINLYYDLNNKWSQIAFYTGKELELLKEICVDPKNNKMYGFECINRIIDMGGQFEIQKPSGGISIDIDTYHDLSYVKNTYGNVKE